MSAIRRMFENQSRNGTSPALVSWHQAQYCPCRQEPSRRRDALKRRIEDVERCDHFAHQIIWGRVKKAPMLASNACLALTAEEQMWALLECFEL